MRQAELDRICEGFHEAYRAAAPNFGWVPQPETDVSWAELPSANREVMRATVGTLLATRIIAPARGEGAEARHDQLGVLETLLLRALYDVAYACSEPTAGVLEILADEEWEDGDCAQIERLLEEERADRQ